MIVEQKKREPVVHEKAARAEIKPAQSWSHWFHLSFQRRWNALSWKLSMDVANHLVIRLSIRWSPYNAQTCAAAKRMLNGLCASAILNWFRFKL